MSSAKSIRRALKLAMYSLKQKESELLKSNQALHTLETESEQIQNFVQVSPHISDSKKIDATVFDAFRAEKMDWALKALTERSHSADERTQRYKTDIHSKIESKAHEARVRVRSFEALLERKQAEEDERNTHKEGRLMDEMGIRRWNRTRNRQY